MPRKKMPKEQSQPTETAGDRGRGPGQQTTARDENNNAGEPAPDRPDPERIAARAYELYLARGGGEGRSMDDWLAAEGELSGGKRD